MEGLHINMPAHEYHADPCPVPALSASIAGIIWHKTPLHGWYAHSRLNPNRKRIDSAIYDVGTAAHSLILERDESKFSIIDAEDWRTKDAKQQRDDAHAAGRVPLLAKQYLEIKAMADAAHKAIGESEIAGILDDGTPEATLIAKDGETWLRGRLDFLPTDRRVIIDYKTVGRSAAPESFLRSSVFQFGYDIQAAMYLRLNAMTGGDPNAKFAWIVQETEEPYLCSILGASPSLIECGNMKLDYVLKQWKRCMETGVWDGYGKKIAWLEAPVWELAKIEEREMVEWT